MNDNEVYILLFVVFIVLLYFLIKFKRDINSSNKLTAEHKEKIKYLRTINSENEHKRINLKHETEKEISALHHKIENLEAKIKDGTKNQVVAMLKSQKNKRDRVLNQVGLSE